MTTYTIIHINPQTGEQTLCKSLTAQTDNGARKQARQYMQQHPTESDLFLTFYRAEDSQHGSLGRID